jgi:hypothetical protein
VGQIIKFPAREAVAGAALLPGPSRRGPEQGEGSSRAREMRYREPGRLEAKGLRDGHESTVAALGWIPTTGSTAARFLQWGCVARRFLQ